jgi:hypothetical protein
MRRRTRAAIALLSGLAGAGLVLAAAPPAAADNAVSWEQWNHQAGIVDLAGPRADGTLVAVAAGRLSIVAPDGTLASFAMGPDGFLGSVDGEPYTAVAPPATGTGCAFNADDAFALDLGSPPGIVRINPTGHASHFATLATAETLGGIAFDTAGQFGGRLLVTGTKSGQTIVFAVDCQGGVSTITDSAPTVEGGLAVAPPGFGAFGGMLVAPDENSGQVWAIAADGHVSLVSKPNLPTGGDTGVESLGFVPQGFDAGGSAYLADRATPNNPFPGIDSILRLSAEAMVRAGVQAGDLLVATEGGGTNCCHPLRNHRLPGAGRCQRTRWSPHRGSHCVRFPVGAKALAEDIGGSARRRLA